MRIIVTGNMGYIGPIVVRQLKKTYAEAQIIGLDAGFFAHCLTNAPVLPESLVDLQYFQDVRNVTQDIFQGADAVVHLAAVSNDPIGNRFEKVTGDVNYKSSERIAALAKQAGVGRFVFASSCSIYGAATNGGCTEDSPLNPLTAYARSKVATEQALAKLADAQFVVTCHRFATACGMSERLRLDLVLNDFVACALSSGEISVLSDGTPWRPLIHVEDMARAIDWAIQRDISQGNYFLAVNTGSNAWNYQIKDLALAVAEVMPEIKVSINKNAQPDKRSYRVNFDLFEKLAPSHQPLHNLHTAIDGLKDGLEAIKFNDRDFRNSNFIRLKVLNDLVASRILDSNLFMRRN